MVLLLSVPPVRCSVTFLYRLCAVLSHFCTGCALFCHISVPAVRCSVTFLYRLYAVLSHFSTVRVFFSLIKRVTENVDSFLTDIDFCGRREIWQNICVCVSVRVRNYTVVVVVVVVVVTHLVTSQKTTETLFMLIPF